MTLLRASRFVALLVPFAAADVLRTSAVRTATLCSMVGWLAFGVLFLAWAWRGMDARAALRQGGRIATLTGVAFAVLFAYYLRSGLIDAGPHTDAVFTYLGARSFLRLENPITFAGRTPSYPQAALMLLAHLPGVAIGFDRLGALAIPLGAIVHLALLLAVATDLLVDGRLGTKAAVVALVSGMYSNRLLVFTYDITGYAFPAVCLALMFIVLAGDRFDDPDRAIGGLLAIALLHHYPGFFMVLPLCILWLLLGRAPWRRIRHFVADNPVVVAVVAMLAIMLVTNPELMLNRVKDASVGASGVDVLRAKVEGNMAFVDNLGALVRHQFFTNTRGSWFLVSLPALGGLVALFVVGSWLVSWSTARRPARHLALFLALGTALGTLTVAQDLVTDFSDYRQFPFLFAMCTAGLAFAFRIPGLRAPWRVAATAYAIAFALFNYVDLGNLQGRTRGVDSAYRSQASMDALWRFVDRPDAARRLGADRVFVVVDPFFPLEPLYLDAVRPKAGVPVATIPVAEACPEGRLSVDDVSRRTCESVLVVAHASHCAIDPGAPPGGPAVRGALFESICDRPLDRAGDRSVVDVDLDGGRRT